MMHASRLALMTTAVAWAAVVLPTSDAQAQQRIVFKVSAENTSYVQQHLIDVGDVTGHQVRIFEIHRTYPSDGPMMNGKRIVESWSRGFSDYTSNNGEGTTYGVYVLENGDKFFTRGALIAAQRPESANLTAMIVGPIVGGTGALARINGMARISGTANPQAGTNESQVDIEYWLPE